MRWWSVTSVSKSLCSVWTTTWWQRRETQQSYETFHLEIESSLMHRTAPVMTPPYNATTSIFRFALIVVNCFHAVYKICRLEALPFWYASIIKLWVPVTCENSLIIRRNCSRYLFLFKRYTRYFSCQHTRILFYCNNISALIVMRYVQLQHHYNRLGNSVIDTRGIQCCKYASCICVEIGG
jgi:hypothetical protein